MSSGQALGPNGEVTAAQLGRMASETHGVTRNASTTKTGRQLNANTCSNKLMEIITAGVQFVILSHAIGP